MVLRQGWWLDRGGVRETRRPGQEAPQPQRGATPDEPQVGEEAEVEARGQRMLLQLLLGAVVDTEQNKPPPSADVPPSCAGHPCTRPYLLAGVCSYKKNGV